MSNRKSKIGILKCQEPLLCYCLSRPPNTVHTCVCIFVISTPSLLLPPPPQQKKKRAALPLLLAVSLRALLACLPACLGCLLALCSLCSPPALQLLLRRYRNAPRPCTRHAIGRVARPTPFDHAHINRGAETVYKCRKGLVVACGLFAFLFFVFYPLIFTGAVGHRVILLFCAYFAHYKRVFRPSYKKNT